MFGNFTCRMSSMNRRERMKSFAWVEWTFEPVFGLEHRGLGLISLSVCPLCDLELRYCWNSKIDRAPCLNTIFCRSSNHTLSYSSFWKISIFSNWGWKLSWKTKHKKSFPAYMNERKLLNMDNRKVYYSYYLYQLFLQKSIGLNKQKLA